MTALRKKIPIGRSTDAAPFAIRGERASDVVAREALLDACFGENRSLRTCQRLRDGHAPAEGLAFSAVRQGSTPGPYGCGTSAPAACRRWCWARSRSTRHVVNSVWDRR